MSPPTASGPPMIAFGSDDLDRAHREWGCNCGPAALAACLGWPIDAVRPHLGGFGQRGYMSIDMMYRAVLSAGFQAQRTEVDWLHPSHGLVRVRWGGPWLLPGVPARAASRYTHWIATKFMGGDCWIFDVNSGWEPERMWEQATAPLIAGSIKRADGSWTFTHRWEVRKARAAPQEGPK